LNPNSGDAYFNRAYFYEERKEFSKSESDYKRAEKLGVINKSMLYNNLAVLYRRMKKFELSIEYLDKARLLNPDFSNIDGTLALIYADKGDDENFYKYLQISLKKGCKVWDYLKDPGFDKYRESQKLTKLIDFYKTKYYS
jgi:tetratricopeptide (TPR) repeat protein